MLVTAVVICDVFAVVKDPKRVVKAPDGCAEMVTVVLATFAVTVPDTVTELPTVTVPEMAGREDMVTLLPIFAVTVPEMGRGL